MLTRHRPHRLAVSVIALLAAALQPRSASADPSGWQVTKVSGHAWTTSADGRHAELLMGAVVMPGTTIVTGELSRVMLVRGQEKMVVGPVAVLAVSETASQGLSTTVLQKGGSVTFDVEKRNVRYFSVETPVLAAVVKGTHFTVTVGLGEGKVDVSRGTVQVTSLATGQSGDVRAGQHAKIGERGMSVSGAGRRTAVQAQPRAAIVSALSEVTPTTVVTGAELAAVAAGMVPSAGASTASYAAGLGTLSNLVSDRSSGGSDSGRSYVGTTDRGQSDGSATGAGPASTFGGARSGHGVSVGSQSAGTAGAGVAGTPNGGTSNSGTSGNGGTSNSGPGGTSNPGGTGGTSNSGTSNAGASGNGGTSSSGSGSTSNAGGAGGKSDNGKGNGGTPGNGGAKNSGSGGTSNAGGAGGKSDNGKGNGGTPGNGKGHG